MRPKKRNNRRVRTDAARREHAELLALLEVTAIVARSADAGWAFERIAAAVRRHTKCSTVAIEVFERGGTGALLAGWSGPAIAKSLRDAVRSVTSGPDAMLLRKRSPVARPVSAVRTAPLFSALKRAGVLTLVSVPLRSDGRAMGVLHVGLAGDGRVPRTVLPFFSALGAEISLLISRYETQDALQLSLDRYRHLFNNALDAIFTLDPATGIIIEANRYAQTLTGFRPARLAGGSIVELAPAEEREEHQKAYARLSAEGEIHGLRTLHFRHRTGRLVAVEINARVVSVGDRALAISIVRNITEQKKAEVQLTASEELLRIIVEGTLDMFFYVHNREGIFTYVSPSVERITGHTVKEWMGRYDTFATDAPVNELMQEHTRRALEDGTVAPPYLCEIYHADGRRIMLEINERPILRDGAVIGVQGVARDITERRRLEQQLIQSQKMESIGLLAGGIAHDFNNILGGILGYASYLKSVVPQDDRIFQHLDTIERSALRAADLTSKLLAFARGGKYVVRPINLNAVVEETLRLLRGSIDRNIHIEEHLSPGLPAIEADAGQIQQVVMNLCVNARDAMPGGGRLTVATSIVPWQAPGLLSQPDVRHLRYIRLTVEDTGVGIDSAIVGKIFDPFFTTKEKGKGTGLGLATVYGIVKNHNGYIDVQSEIGKGTLFSVQFPAVEDEAVTAEEKREVVTGGAETILVVDDEETIRRLLRDLLQAKGYSVLEAADGREALALYTARRDEIDLVVLDMVMPELGGRETYVRLREINPGVRTILSTGYAEDERARELLAMGVMAFVQKPYRVEELARVVRGVLDAPAEGK